MDPRYPLCQLALQSTFAVCPLDSSELKVTLSLVPLNVIDAVAPCLQLFGVHVFSLLSEYPVLHALQIAPPCDVQADPVAATPLSQEHSLASHCLVPELSV
jgi:hypothetical protein